MSRDFFQDRVVLRIFWVSLPARLSLATACFTWLRTEFWLVENKVLGLPRSTRSRLNLHNLSVQCLNLHFPLVQIQIKNELFKPLTHWFCLNFSCQSTSLNKSLVLRSKQSGENWYRFRHFLLKFIPINVVWRPRYITTLTVSLFRMYTKKMMLGMTGLKAEWTCHEKEEIWSKGNGRTSANERTTSVHVTNYNQWGVSSRSLEKINENVSHCRSCLVTYLLLVTVWKEINLGMLWFSYSDKQHLI